MRALIVVLRNRDTIDIGDGVMVPVPQLPSTWTVKPQPQRNTVWVYLVRPNSHAYWWRTMIDGPDVGQPTKIVGIAAPVDPTDSPALRAWAASNDRAWTLPELRADGGVVAVAIKAAWRETDAGTGAALLRSTIAGFDFRLDSERYARVDDIPEAA